MTAAIVETLGAPSRVPGYELPPPVARDVRRALRRNFGEERAAAIWEGACRAAGLEPEGDAHAPEELSRVADVLGQQDGVTRVIGRSLAIRIATYLVLSAQQAATSATADPRLVPGSAP